jgi:hypothetical protein
MIIDSTQLELTPIAFSSGQALEDLVEKTGEHVYKLKVGSDAEILVVAIDAEDSELLKFIKYLLSEKENGL